MPTRFSCVAAGARVERKGTGPQGSGLPPHARPETAIAPPSLSPRDTRAVLALFLDAARVSGDMALGYFRHGAPTAARVDYKQGGSPVTEADIAVDRYLNERLCAAVPEAAWLSEETVDDLSRLERPHVLVVDPIDGTRNFTAGDPYWAVSIALVTDGRPVAGVVHAPALDRTYAAVLGGGAEINGGPVAPLVERALVGARLSAPEGFIRPLARGVAVDLVPKISSLACRFAAVASGHIDAAVGSPNSHDWDIAAVDLILHEAGGRLTAADGLPRRYNCRIPRHPTLYGAGIGLHAALLAAGRRFLGSGA